MRLMNAFLRKIFFSDSSSIFTYNCLKFLRILGAFNSTLLKKINFQSRLLYVEGVRSQYRHLNANLNSLTIIQGQSLASADQLKSIMISHVNSNVLTGYFSLLVTPKVEEPSDLQHGRKSEDEKQQLEGVLHFP